MRKSIALVLLVGAALALPTVSGAGDAKGPACTDVVGGDWIYLGGTTVVLDATLASTPCTFVTYTLYVYSDNTPTATLLGSTTFYTQPITLPPEAIRFTLPIGATDGEVCIVMTTSIGRRVFDQAPDSGCQIVTADPPGFQNFG